MMHGQKNIKLHEHSVALPSSLFNLVKIIPCNSNKF